MKIQNGVEGAWAYTSTPDYHTIADYRGSPSPDQMQVVCCKKRESSSRNLKILKNCVKTEVNLCNMRICKNSLSGLFKKKKKKKYLLVTVDEGFRWPSVGKTFAWQTRSSLWLMLPNFLKPPLIPVHLWSRDLPEGHWSNEPLPLCDHDNHLDHTTQHLKTTDPDQRQPHYDPTQLKNVDLKRLQCLGT